MGRYRAPAHPLRPELEASGDSEGRLIAPKFHEETSGGEPWTWWEDGSETSAPPGLYRLRDLLRVGDRVYWQDREYRLHCASLDGSSVRSLPVSSGKVIRLGAALYCVDEDPQDPSLHRYTRLDAEGRPTSTFTTPRSFVRIRSVVDGVELLLWRGDYLGVSRLDDGAELWRVPYPRQSARLAAAGNVVAVSSWPYPAPWRIDVFDLNDGRVLERWEIPDTPTRKGAFFGSLEIATDGLRVLWAPNNQSMPRDRKSLPETLEWRAIGGGGRGAIALPDGWRVQSLGYSESGVFDVCTAYDPDYLTYGRGGIGLLRWEEGAPDRLEVQSRPVYSITPLAREGKRHGFRIAIDEPDLDRLVRFAWVLMMDVVAKNGRSGMRKHPYTNRHFDGTLELVVARRELPPEAAVWLDALVARWETEGWVNSSYIASGDGKSPIRATWRWLGADESLGETLPEKPKRPRAKKKRVPPTRPDPFPEPDVPPQDLTPELRAELESMDDVDRMVSILKTVDPLQALSWMAEWSGADASSSTWAMAANDRRLARGFLWLLLDSLPETVKEMKQESSDATLSDDEG